VIPVERRTCRRNETHYYPPLDCRLDMVPQRSRRPTQQCRILTTSDSSPRSLEPPTRFLTVNHAREPNRVRDPPSATSGVVDGIHERCDHPSPSRQSVGSNLIKNKNVLGKVDMRGECEPRINQTKAPDCTNQRKYTLLLQEGRAQEPTLEHLFAEFRSIQPPPQSFAINGLRSFEDIVPAQAGFPERDQLMGI